MSEEKKDSNKKPPLVITIICILGFLGAGVGFLSLFIPEIRNQMVQEYGILIVPITMLVFMMGFIGLVVTGKCVNGGLFLFCNGNYECFCWNCS
jgi:hypothetical protein